jgi:hypothetical protein
MTDPVQAAPGPQGPPPFYAPGGVPDDAPHSPNRAQRRAYVRQRKVYRLVFEEGTEEAGLVVKARGVPLGTLLELVDLASVVDGRPSEFSTDDAEALRKLFMGFAEALVSWNLEEPVLDADGNETGASQAVPATYDGLNSQDMDFVLPVIKAWMDALAAVPAPLGQPSTGGVPSPAASLPMEPLSPSPTS